MRRCATLAIALTCFLSQLAFSALDSARNFSKSTVSTGYTSAATSIVLVAGGGAKFAAPPFNAVWWNATDYGDPSDDPGVEIVRVTGLSTDTLTVTRAQESTSASNHNTAGKVYLLVAGPTAKLTTDILTINTTGSAATLTTTRAINGVNFDGSAPITVTADANTLSGTTLKSTILASSLTSVGVLSGLEIINDSPTLAFRTRHSNLTQGVAIGYNSLNGDGSVANFSIHINAKGTGAVNLNSTGTGNVGINTEAFGTSAASVLGIGNGTAPSTSPADMIQMWAEDVAASSELRVRDEAGNVTTLSPHNVSLYTPDPSQIFPWSYYSRSGFLGKELNVDMYGAIAALEKLTGKTFIYSRDLASGDIEDWTAQEAAKKLTVEKQRLDKALMAEVEVGVADAVEVVTITMSQPSATLTETVTKYVLDAATGKVKAETVTTPKMETIDTPKTESRLKAGVRLDEATGKFWRKKRADEVVVEPYVPKAPPAWIADRLAKKATP